MALFMVEARSTLGALLFRNRSIKLKTYSAFSSISEDGKDSTQEASVDEIDRIRYVSRMPEHFWKRMTGHVDEPKAVLEHMRERDQQLPRKERRVLKKHYGRYGKASGLNPGICWPTKKELEEVKMFENEFYQPLQEMMAAIQKERRAEKEIRQKREEEVEANYAKLQKWIKDLEDRQAKKLAEARAQREKKEKLIEEVRAYFGYRIDPKDDRFKELLEKKEKEERKAIKEAKKKEKIAKELARMTAAAEKEKKQALVSDEKSSEDKSSTEHSNEMGNKQ